MGNERYSNLVSFGIPIKNVKAGKSLDYSTSMITFLGIGAVSSTKDAFFIDNVTFK